MSHHAQRQDASEHVIGHITHAVVSDDSKISAIYENNLPSRNFQACVERATTHFPYNLFTVLPQALKTVLIIILFGFLVKGIIWIILPMVSLCSTVRDGIFSLAESLKTIFLPTSWNHLRFLEQHRRAQAVREDNVPAIALQELPANLQEQLQRHRLSSY